MKDPLLFGMMRYIKDSNFSCLNRPWELSHNRDNHRKEGIKMPDITMCANSDCKAKDMCYRYRAIPSDYQSIAFFNQDNRDLCRSFWMITTERVRPVVEADVWWRGNLEDENDDQKADIKDKELV